MIPKAVCKDFENMGGKLFDQSQLFVFDLDGTLVDTFDDIAQAVNHVLGIFGLAPRSVDEVRGHVGNGVRQLMSRMMGDFAKRVSPEERESLFDKAIEAWRKYYLEHPAERSRLYPDVQRVLELLRSRSIRLAVFSNKLQEITERVLEELGIVHLLDEVIGENSRFPRKPDPEGLFFLMKKFHARPETTWMVGDGEADVQVGLAAGCRICGVSYGILSRTSLLASGAHVVIDSFGDLVL